MNCCGTFNARRAPIFQKATTQADSRGQRQRMPSWTCSNCNGPASIPCPACFTTLCRVCSKLESHETPTGRHVGNRCAGYQEIDRTADARLRIEAKLATAVAKPWDLSGFVKVERVERAAE